MNILITGSKGQLGQELQSILGLGMAEIGCIPKEYCGARVIALDYDNLDITDSEAINTFLLGENFDLIINCAAMTNVDACETEKEKAFLVNAFGPQNLAKVAQTCGAKLVQISTDYVFSGEDGTPRVESCETDPRSVYGYTKLEGERLVQETCENHFIVRTAWLYGYRGNNFVKTILKLADEQGVIKVVNDQFGNPTSANDLAYEVLKIAVTNNFGIYHCTNEGTCSWFEFASTILDTVGILCERIPCTTEEFPRPAKRPKYSSLKNEHLEKTIGNEMRPWQDALREYLANLKTKGEL